MATFRNILETAYSTNGNEYNCSGFVRDVAAGIGVKIVGENADAQLDFMDRHWVRIKTALEATVLASRGFLVVAGVKSSDYNPPRKHGHVVIVRPVSKKGAVDSSDLDRGKYPRVWGGDIGRKYMSQGELSIGNMLRKEVRDTVRYYAPSITAPQTPTYD